MVKYLDFVKVIVSWLEGDGIKKGDILFVAGTTPVQENKDKPYDLRVKCITCKTEEGHVKSNRFFLIDPDSVEVITGKDYDSLYATLKKDFGEKEIAEAPDRCGCSPI